MLRRKERGRGGAAIGREAPAPQVQTHRPYRQASAGPDGNPLAPPLMPWGNPYLENPIRPVESGERRPTAPPPRTAPTNHHACPCPSQRAALATPRRNWGRCTAVAIVHRTSDTSRSIPCWALPSHSCVDA